MLPKTRRLSRKNFLIAKSQGSVSRYPHLNIIFYSTRLGISRFSVVTSKKFHPKAVIRNKYRRYLYEYLAGSAGSFDLILFLKPSMLKLSHEEIPSLLSQVLSSLPLRS